MHSLQDRAEAALGAPRQTPIRRLRSVLLTRTQVVASLDRSQLLQAALAVARASLLVRQDQVVGNGFYESQN